MFYVYSWNVYVWLAVNVFVFNNIMKNYHNFRFDENDIATWHQPRTVHHHNQTPQQLSNSQKLQPNWNKLNWTELSWKGGRERESKAIQPNDEWINRSRNNTKLIEFCQCFVSSFPFLKQHHWERQRGSTVEPSHLNVACSTEYAMRYFTHPASVSATCWYWHPNVFTTSNAKSYNFSPNHNEQLHKTPSCRLQKRHMLWRR